MTINSITRKAPGDFDFPNSRILIFCKAPVPGHVKTRLIPMLGESGAADLARELAEARINMCIESALAPVELWCAPTLAHGFFEQYRGLLEIQLQTGGDLGERMHNGFVASLGQANVEAAVLIGTDCPTLDSQYLENALQALASHDAVLGPAEDGGYGLIGLRQPTAEVFAEGIKWSTDSVLDETRHRLDKCCPGWALLPLLWDVDRPEDVERYRLLEDEAATRDRS